MKRPLLFVATFAALLGFMLWTAPAAARTLAQVKARNAISVCANPDALPFASQKSEPPGFQIELARAIAAGLGVSIEMQWIMPRRRASMVNCDMLLDSIDDPELYEGKLLLTRPYHKTGVALGVRDGAQIQSFADLRKGQKIGVMINSMASVVLGKRGVTTSPYAFEQDMLDDLIKGDLFGAAISPAKLAYTIQQQPQSGLKLIHAYDGEPELAWNVTVGLRKSDPALVAAVDQVLERLLADGTIADIYARYGVEHRMP